MLNNFIFKLDTLMKKLKNKITLSCLTGFMVLLNFSTLLAQCPMCRAAAEQNLASGGEAARGLNNGILYLLVTPYLIVGIIGVIWYYRYQKSNRLTVEDILNS